MQYREEPRRLAAMKLEMGVQRKTKMNMTLSNRACMTPRATPGSQTRGSADLQHRSWRRHTGGHNSLPSFKGSRPQPEPEEGWQPHRVLQAPAPSN